MSVKIVTYPTLRILDVERKLWSITNDPLYLWTHENTQTPITIPIGFPTDGASIPRGLWNLFPPFDSTYVEAAIVHDFLYASHLLVKEEADLVFYETMVTLKTFPLTRETLYWGVRWAGGSSYASGPARWEERKRIVRTLLKT